MTKSGYYAWKKRRQAGPAKRGSVQRSFDRQGGAVYAESGGVYAAPQAAAQLAGQNVCVDETTVTTSLRGQGLEEISPRRFKPATTLPVVVTHHIPDLVKRVWDVMGWMPRGLATLRIGARGMGSCICASSAMGAQAECLGGRWLPDSILTSWNGR
ncbi:hypothetical protein GCM10009690_11570 [Brevibacterium permense]|uniref:Transposase n=1 Tax=Brevibacterium permense TaxID=234834 RepID=A0ABN2A2Z6_9MICO